MSIPKIIWQTWKDENIPDQWRAGPQAIREHCSNWAYHLMTDRDNLEFVQKEYPQYLELYQSFDREIYRVDLVRYLLLHRYGGVYLDLDLKPLCSLDSLFEHGELFLTRTPNLDGYTNSLMGSAPGVPFWLQLVELISQRARSRPFWIQGDLKVLWTTGPGVITEAIKQYNRPYVTIPAKVGHPCSICDHYLYRVCESDWIEELPGSSWTQPTTQLFYLFACRWQWILAIVLLLLGLLIAWVIDWNKGL